MGSNEDGAMIFKMTHIALITTVFGVLAGEGSRAAVPDGDPANRLVALQSLDHDVERNGGGEWVQLAQAGNRPPRVRQRIRNQTFQEGSRFTFSIPAGTFSDPDGDRLFITVRENVDWIRANGTTLTITPAAFDAPARVRVRARDRRQGGLSVETSFRVAITPLRRKDEAEASDNVPNRNGEVEEVVPAISANGRFTAQRFEGGSDNPIVEGIRVRDTAGGDLWTVFSIGDETAFDIGFVSNPAMSADGRIVAFAETVDQDEVRIVRIADADPLDVDEVRTFGVEIEDAGEAVVSLSADGRFVAFEDGENVVVANVVRGRPLPIDIGSNPSVSRTGSLIAYHRPGSDGLEVVLATLNRNRTRVIDTTVIGPGSNPVVSADGGFVAFESDASDLAPCDTNDRSDIFVYNRRDESIARASVDADGDEFEGGVPFGGFFNPSLSANGRRIAFDSSRDAEEVFVRNLDRQGKRRGELRNVGALVGDGAAAQPALSANGRFVAFNIDFTVFSVPAFSADAPTVDFPIDPSDNDVPDEVTTQARLDLGSRRHGEIDPAFDADWYSVQLEEGQSYRFALQADPQADACGGTPLGDPFLELRGDLDGDFIQDLLASDDDSGGGLNDLDAQLDFVAPSSGTFFVVARAFNDETGDYVLSVVTPTPAATVSR